MGKAPRVPTEAVTSEIVRLVKAGATVEAAAKATLGRAHARVFEWLSIGEGTHPNRKARKPFTTFHDAIVRAEGHAEARHAVNLTTGAVGGTTTKETTVTRPDGSTITARTRQPARPKYSLLWLERRARKSWSPPTRRLVAEFPDIAEQLRQVHLRAHDPRELPPAEDDVVDAEATPIIVKQPMPVQG